MLERCCANWIDVGRVLSSVERFCTGFDAVVRFGTIWDVCYEFVNIQDDHYGNQLCNS